MPALNEINRAARLHAEREYQKRLERQKAEFWAAMASAGMFFVTVVVTLIAVGCVYHGGIGWLL
jgi:cobalamin biosynthesis Mg chelatase CobN